MMEEHIRASGYRILCGSFQRQPGSGDSGSVVYARQPASTLGAVVGVITGNLNAVHVGNEHHYGSVAGAHNPFPTGTPVVLAPV